ncbi:class D beta-lactamase [Nisaea sp.]|uniref:class D beta-lactamase n=1 Tax=Nisaea sp. TaxID=2024842 RepID=UPI003266802B
MTRSFLHPMTALFLLAVIVSVPANGATICTIVLDANTGERLIDEGACETRQSPASTFKIAISLMGYDAGILQTPEQPEWPFEEGYIDWRKAWRAPANPTRWMRESVVWYSQQVTLRLGAERYAKYVDCFSYGNRDVSGGPGNGNGLTEAWLSSSLRISPLEQVGFLRKLVRRELPVSDGAVRNTATLLKHEPQPGGWLVFGKTGTGLPRDKADRLLRGKPFGWFVGWAEHSDGSVVFARLIQEAKRPLRPAGLLARDGLLDDLFGPDGHLN